MRCSRMVGTVGCGTVSPKGRKPNFWYARTARPLVVTTSSSSRGRPHSRDQAATASTSAPSVPLPRWAGLHIDRHEHRGVRAGRVGVRTDLPDEAAAELRHVLGVLAAGRGAHAPADVLVVLVFGDLGQRRDEGERRVGQHLDPQAADGAGVLAW